MPYTFDGINDFFNEDGTVSPLYKKMYDDVWKCIHCGCKDIVWKATPEYAAMMGGARMTRNPQEVHCKKCGERLTYLEDRFYGLSAEELRKREKKDPRLLKPWGRKPPLWAIGNNDEKTD